LVKLSKRKAKLTHKGSYSIRIWINRKEELGECVSLTKFKQQVQNKNKFKFQKASNWRYPTISEFYTHECSTSIYNKLNWTNNYKIRNEAKLNFYRRTVSLWSLVLEVPCILKWRIRFMLDLLHYRDLHGEINPLIIMWLNKLI
jgi:hypothetical protein